MVRDIARLYVGLGGVQSIAGSVVVVVGIIKALSPHVESLYKRARRSYTQEECKLLLSTTDWDWGKYYISADYLDRNGFRKSIKEAEDYLVSTLSVRYNVSPILVAPIKGVPSSKFRTEFKARNPFTFTVYRQAFYLFKEYLDSAHFYYPAYDWINNSGSLTLPHLNALIGKGPSPEHRLNLIKRLPYWVHQRLIKQGKSYFPKYFLKENYLSGPAWWPRYFNKPFYKMGPPTYVYDIENVLNND